MKKYVIYCRKSTNDPNHQLYSLGAQEKICRDHAERNNLRIENIIIEKHSAKDAGKRPLFNKLLADLHNKKYDGIIVHKVDRLLRNIGDYAKIDALRAQNVEFIFCDGSYPNTPDGNMMLAFNVIFAKRYVDNLSVEVKKGYTEALSQGKFPRPAPIGYLDCGRGVKDPDPKYAPLVQETFRLYATGQYSIGAILKIMKEKGLRTKKGNKYGNAISRSSLHRILTNKFYYGEIIYNGESYEGAHNPIINRELFDKVQKILNTNNTSFKTKKPYAFRGLIKCEACGYTLSPYSKKGFTYYACTNKPCKESTTNENQIVEALSGIIDTFAFSEGELKGVKKALYQLEGKINEERNSRFKLLEKKEKQLVHEMDKARKLLIEGAFSKKDYHKEKSRIQASLQGIKIEKEAYYKTDEKRADEIYDFLELAKNAPMYFKHGTVEEKNELIRLSFLELRIKDKQMANYKLKPEFAILAERHFKPSGGTDGTRTRDLLRAIAVRQFGLSHHRVLFAKKLGAGRYPRDYCWDSLSSL
ncbi:recombinase family protein [Patescibacteria group bacterium]|nr:recombinase family protein [Patescibacteria group bacterium]